MNRAATAAVIGELCKELKLPTIARQYAELCRQAQDDSWPYESYLQELLTREIHKRTRAR